MNPETPSRLNPTFSGQAPITPTGFLRAIRFPLLALVLAGALLSMAIPASAAPSQQTVTTLVSNTGQATTGFSTLASSSPVHAQGFKTGPNRCQCLAAYVRGRAISRASQAPTGDR